MKRLFQLVASACCVAACTSKSAPDPAMQKLTPLLTVEAIEPGLGFWCDGLGFQVTAEVPEGDRLGFVILQNGGMEVMLQTRASVEADDARLATEISRSASMLYVQVDDLDAVSARIADAPVVVPRRTTFYGADELFVRTPGGHIVGLAEMQTEPSEPE